MSESAVDSRDLLDQAVALVNSIIDGFATEDWSRPSTCVDWNTAQVLAHATGTASLVTKMAPAGKSAPRPEIPDNGDGEATRQAWRDVTAQAIAAARASDPIAEVKGANGLEPFGAALGLPISDIAIHAWDLAASVGQDLELPPDLFAHVSTRVAGLPDHVLRRPGLFGPAIEAPADANETDALMAFLGRSRP